MEIMLLAHLADTHLGYAQYGRSWREEDVYRVFSEAFEKALSEGVDVIVISGDMFDRYRPPNRALKVAMEVVRKALDRGVRVYSILGEHDIPKRYDEVPQILVSGLKLLGTHKTPSHDIVTIDDRDYAIAGISHYPPTLKHLSKLKERLQSLRSVLRNHKSILMLHQNIKQFFALEEGLDINDIPREVNYVALGHLHRRIISRLEEGTVIAYPGSLEILRSDEIDEWLSNGKGFYIVDLSSDEPIIHKVDVDVRPQLRISAKYPNHVISVKNAVARLRSLGVGIKWDRGILHVDIELPMSKKELGRDVVGEVVNAVGPSIYLRTKVKIVKNVERIPEIEGLRGIDEVGIIAKLLGVEGDIGERLAKLIIKLKNILAEIEEGDWSTYVDEILKFESVWRGKVAQLKIPERRVVAAKPEVSKEKLQPKGKGLLKFLGGS
ncbi:MAG: hypothetical protein DRO18_04890 [Thermoprotei archaeon]|nr:MAG: hypothetical protein DRO18_04890 [Thermoprotei archaeon]